MLTDASRRADFPSLSNRTYLNTAAEGIPPRAVIDALAAYGRDKLLGMDGRPFHEEQRRQLKARTAHFFGLSEDEIGICSCSSEAYNLAAMALRLREGDEAIVNDLDFPAGATPFIGPVSPATSRVWHHRGGSLRIEDLIPLLNKKTRLLTLSLVSFFNGYRAALGPVIEAVRRHSSALVALDVTQALGRIPLDLRGVDLIVSSTHKWILGSHGGGLVGVPKHRAAELTVPAGGWFNLQDAFGADRFTRVTHKPGAASFSVGMPNYGAIYAVNAALGYIESVGVEAIDNYARPLVRRCLDGLRQLPVELLTPDEPGALAGILAFKHPRAEQVHRALHESNIHIMHQAGRMRVAIHGYNTAADIERLLEALKGALR